MASGAVLAGPRSTTATTDQMVASGGRRSLGGGPVVPVVAGGRRVIGVVGSSQWSEEAVGRSESHLDGEPGEIVFGPHLVHAPHRRRLDDGVDPLVTDSFGGRRSGDPGRQLIDRHGVNPMEITSRGSSRL